MSDAFERAGTPERVRAFFDSYRAVFERLDANAISEHFTFPVHVTSDSGEVDLTSISGRDEWRGSIERLVEMYRTIGVRSVHLLRLRTENLSPRVMQAIVHWALRDDSGSDLYDFLVLYTLVEIDGALRIAAIAHDEIPRAQELMTRWA
jgi:hypothetical protein